MDTEEGKRGERGSVCVTHSFTIKFFLAFFWCACVLEVGKSRIRVTFRVMGEEKEWYNLIISGRIIFNSNKFTIMFDKMISCFCLPVCVNKETDGY